MKASQLWCGALMLSCAAVVACNRPDAARSARETGEEIKVAAAKAAVKAGDELADGWLTTKIQAQFFADDDIKARYINVSSRDGVVVLRGRVETENAHQQAVQTARNTDGVKQLVDQLTVGPIPQGGSGAEQIDAAWTTTKIQARYFADPDVKGRDINVTANNGVVTLTGHVESEQQRQKAVTIARETNGVTRVDDRLAVQPSGGAPGSPVATSGAAPEPAAAVPDDARITSSIQSKYFLDDTMKTRRLHVQASRGVVALTGEVASDSERAWALLLARTTEGVQRVEDQLTVNAALAAPAATAREGGGVQVDDTLVTTRIESRYFADPDVKASTVAVTAKDGVVLLDGTVATKAAHDRAVAIARETDGVVQVVDRIMVKATRIRKK